MHFGFVHANPFCGKSGAVNYSPHLSLNDVSAGTDYCAIEDHSATFLACAIHPQDTVSGAKAILCSKSRELWSSVYGTLVGGLHDKFPRLWPCVEFGDIICVETLPIFGDREKPTFAIDC